MRTMCGSTGACPVFSTMWTSPSSHTSWSPRPVVDTGHGVHAFRHPSGPPAPRSAYTIGTKRGNALPADPLRRLPIMAHFFVGNRVRVLSTPAATASYVSRSGTVARVARNFAGAWGVSYVVSLDDD